MLQKCTGHQQQQQLNNSVTNTWTTYIVHVAKSPHICLQSPEPVLMSERDNAPSPLHEELTDYAQSMQPLHGHAAPWKVEKGVIKQGSYARCNSHVILSTSNRGQRNHWQQTLYPQPQLHHCKSTQALCTGLKVDQHKGAAANHHTQPISASSQA